MSASESDREPEHYVEHDERETRLSYGGGKVPLYVGLLWLVFILTYVGVMVALALPDLRAWSSR
jgi:hypothetical protein